MTSDFRGWRPAAFDFYRDLEADNSRDFWLAHKATYDDEVRAPFDQLSELIADELGPLKVFRPNRDTRFSPDKTPYKTRCYGVVRGDGGETWYVEISADGLRVGGGHWMMANDQLARYRAAVDDGATGAALAAIVAELTGGPAARRYDVASPGLKTAPRGYPKDHPRVELLRAKSLAAIRHVEPTRWLGTKDAGPRILDLWRGTRPLVDWLVANVGPTTEPVPERWRPRARKA